MAPSATAAGDVTVALPEKKVLGLLAAEVASIVSLANTIKFNLEHRQFDLMTEHLAAIEEHRRVAENLRQALAAA